MRTLLVLLIAAAICGCASQGARVRCDSKLEPINRPATVHTAEKPLKRGEALPESESGDAS